MHKNNSIVKNYPLYFWTVKSIFNSYIYCKHISGIGMKRIKLHPYCILNCNIIVYIKEKTGATTTPWFVSSNTQLQV